MAAVVLDASAVIAYAEGEDPVANLTAQGTTRLLPASAYSEILIGPLRAGTTALLDGLLAVADVEVVPIDARIARVAAEARAERPSLRLPDALVVATALVRECELVTLDRRMRDAHRALAKTR